MTDAPKKIWATGWFLDPTCRWWSDRPLGENAAKTEYIRADLTPSPEVVKELVEALRGAADAISLALNDEAIGDGRLKAALTDAGIDARKQIEKWG